MNRVTTISKWIVEVGLLTILILTPVSFASISTHHTFVLLAIVLGFLVILFKKRYDVLTLPSGRIVVALIFMFSFGFANHYKLTGMFGLFEGSGVKIPLATLVLFIAGIAWLVKVAVMGKVCVPDTLFGRSILMASLCVMFFMVLLYPVLRVQYQMDPEVNLHLLRNILQILLLLFLVINNLNTNAQAALISLAIVVSFSLTVGLSWLGK